MAAEEEGAEAQQPSKVSSCTLPLSPAGGKGGRIISGRMGFRDGKSCRVPIVFPVVELQESEAIPPCLLSRDLQA